MSPDWLQQLTATHARVEALARLAQYEREREERMAQYRRTWDVLFAAQRAKAAKVTESPSRYLRVVK